MPNYNVPDYNDLLQAHEAEKEAWLDRRPKCERCRKPIQDDYLFDVDGKIYCEDCMNEKFRHSSEDYER